MNSQNSDLIKSRRRICPLNFAASFALQLALGLTTASVRATDRGAEPSKETATETAPDSGAPSVLLVAAPTADLPTVAPAPAAAEQNSALKAFAVDLVPYVVHTNIQTHYKYSWLVGAEYRFESKWKVMGAYFVNSFGQQCQTVHVGKRIEFFDDENLFFEASLGIVHGYLPPHNKSAYANRSGWGPSFSLTVGRKITKNLEIALDRAGAYVYLPRLILHL